MGAIEDIYADLEAEVSEEEFREAVEEKVEQMEGLADEETAAMIIAHEVADGDVDTVADIEAAMDDVKFVAKVLSIGELRTFERDDGEGKVVNVEAADETDTIWLSFWDEQAENVVEGDLEPGDVLKIKGRPREGYKGLEVSVSRAEVDEDTTIDVDLDGTTTVDSLSMGQSDVTIRGMVLDTDSINEFDRDDGSTGRVANFTIGEETGRIRVTLWDEQVELVEDLEPGMAVEVVDGYVKEREGNLELHVNEHSAVDEIDEPIEYDPDTTPIAEVSIGQDVDIAGVVRSTDPIRTFDRDDGSEGQVRNIRVQDDTDDIRMALWGKKADIEVAPGDELLATDVEIQDGWQDDLEASAGWQSAVVVLDEADVSLDNAPDAAEQDSSDASPTKRPPSAEATDGDDESTASASDTPTGLDSFAAEGSSTVSGAAGAVTERKLVEFTGTVVQTGDPVVLDDGTETMSVETDQTLRLGEEVTVRGHLADERLDADEIL